MSTPSVVLINAFEVLEGEDEAFLASWEQARAHLAAQDGYLSTRLHRSLSAGADFRFVNVGRWASAHAFQAATSTAAFRNAKHSVPLPCIALPGHPGGRAMTAPQQRRFQRAIRLATGYATAIEVSATGAARLQPRIRPHSLPPAVLAGAATRQAARTRRLRKALGRGRRVDLNQRPCPPEVS